MIDMRLRWLGLGLALSLLACGGPFVLLPGGELEGESVPAPESWAFTDAVDTVQLETNPGEPYSVNIWVVALDGKLYVHAGANRATWVENLELDPHARLRVDDSIYSLEASRVTSQEEFDRFSDAYEQKYGRRPRNENVDEAYLFALVPR
jgi:hypothetical protein